MKNLFSSDSMAAGYATARPEIHSEFIERVRERLGFPDRIRRALDIGCGAGLSTRPLQQIAEHCFGIEPAEPMLKWTAAVAPEAAFLVGRAEALPVRSDSIDLITAAGSLNYADLSLFFPEAHRILTPGGSLVIYDYSQGKEEGESSDLNYWFDEFMTRYPRPRDSAHKITPESLALLGCGFAVSGHELLGVRRSLGLQAWLDYMMTETNVACAVRDGTPEEEIRSWCANSLSPLFQTKPTREVVFSGYIAYLSPV